MNTSSKDDAIAPVTHASKTGSTVVTPPDTSAVDIATLLGEPAVRPWYRKTSLWLGLLVLLLAAGAAWYWQARQRASTYAWGRTVTASSTVPSSEMRSAAAVTRPSDGSLAASRKPFASSAASSRLDQSKRA